jgi:hypothetical protein
VVVTVADAGLAVHLQLHAVEVMLTIVMVTITITTVMLTIIVIITMLLDKMMLNVVIVKFVTLKKIVIDLEITLVVETLKLINAVHGTMDVVHMETEMPLIMEDSVDQMQVVVLSKEVRDIDLEVLELDSPIISDTTNINLLIKN